MSLTPEQREARRQEVYRLLHGWQWMHGSTYSINYGRQADAVLDIADKWAEMAASSDA